MLWNFFSLHWELCKVCIEPERNHHESELLKSLKCKECAGDRSLNQIKLRRNNTSEGVVETRNSFPGRSED
jgi:translation initiation factor 2 beta subunit (eIF-2beta)/eIF-5